MTAVPSTIQISLEFQQGKSNDKYKMSYDNRNHKLNWNILVDFSEENPSFDEFFFDIYQSANRLEPIELTPEIISTMVKVYMEQLEIMMNQKLTIPQEAEHYKTIFPNGGKHFGNSIFCQLFIDNVVACFALLFERKNNTKNKSQVLHITKKIKEQFESVRDEFVIFKLKIQADLNAKKRKSKKTKKQQQTKEIMRELDAEWKEQEDMGREDNNILTMITRAMQEREERYLMECEDQPTFDFELYCREVLTIGYECLDFEARVDVNIPETFVYSLEELNFSNVVFML